MLAAQYLSFVGKNNFNFVATWADTAVKLRAVEIGTPSRVLSVTSGLEFSEPGYGTSYKTIYLVAMNTSPTTNLSLRIDSVSTTTVTPGSTLVPRSTALLPSYPNSFNPETTIQFFLRDAGEISLKIYSIDGSEVVTLLQGWVPGGEHHVAWVPKGLASGVYICRLDADHQQFSRKIAFIK